MSAAVATLGTSLRKGRIKIILIAVAVLLLLGGGVVAFIAMKSVPVEEEDDEDVVVEHKAKAAPIPYDPKNAPVFVPLEAFTVNLADREAERYAQIGVTLEVEDAKASEQVRAYMPVIRNNILMVLSHKTVEDLRTGEGKRLLAAELRAQALRPLGFELTAQELLDDAEPGKGAKARAKARKLASLPIKAVNFSNFIVQ
jgi:flagellar FliL protein